MNYTYDNHYRFETIQLHAGQETPDAVSDARAVPMPAPFRFIRRPPMFLRTPHMRRRASASPMRAISTAD